MQAYGQPGGPDQGGIMAQAGQAMAMAGQGGQAGTRPTARNAIMTMVLPYACIFGGAIVSTIFGIIAGVAGVAIIAMLGGLLSLAASIVGMYFFIVPLLKMVAELNSVTKNPAFAWWMALIPFYGPVLDGARAPAGGHEREARRRRYGARALAGPLLLPVPVRARLGHQRDRCAHALRITPSALTGLDVEQEIGGAAPLDRFRSGWLRRLRSSRWGWPSSRGYRGGARSSR